MVIAKYVLGTSEIKKYSVDYSGWLGDGEVVVGVTFEVSLVTTPPLSISDSVIDDTGTVVTFYAQGGDGKSLIPVGITVTTSFAQIKTDTINYASHVGLGPGEPAGTLIIPTVVVGIIGSPTVGDLVGWAGPNTLTTLTTLPISSLPAFTGEVTNPLGSATTTITKSITPVWTGTHKWLNAGINIQRGTDSTVASSIPQAIYTNQNFGTGTLAGAQTYNRSVIIDAYSCVNLNGWTYNFDINGGGGNRTAMSVNYDIYAKPTPTGPNDRNALALLASATVQPGVDAGGSNLFAFNPQVIAYPGVTNLPQIQVQEIDLSIAFTCTSVDYAHGLAITYTNQANPGTPSAHRRANIQTAAQVFYSMLQTPGFSDIWVIGDPSGVNQSPFGPAAQANVGTILRLAGSPSVYKGIDLTSAAPVGADATGFAFGSNSFIVDWAGVSYANEFRSVQFPNTRLTFPSASLFEVFFNTTLSMAVDNAGNMSLAGSMSAVGNVTAATYKLGTTARLYDTGGVYTTLAASTNLAAIHVGNVSDPSTYYRNTKHWLQDIPGTSTWLTASSSGVNPGADNVTALGTPSLRWSNIQANTAGFTGLMTWGTGTIGSIGQANVIRLYDTGSASTSYGFGVSGGALNFVSGSQFLWCVSGTQVGDYGASNSGKWTFGGGVIAPLVALTSTTVGALPSAALFPGTVYYVTDGTGALAWGATVTGSSSTKYLVWSNGTNWTVVGK